MSRREPPLVTIPIAIYPLRASWAMSARHRGSPDLSLVLALTTRRLTARHYATFFSRYRNVADQVTAKIEI